MKGFHSTVFIRVMLIGFLCVFRYNFTTSNEPESHFVCHYFRVKTFFGSSWNLEYAIFIVMQC